MKRKSPFNSALTLLSIGFLFLACSGASGSDGDDKQGASCSDVCSRLDELCGQEPAGCAQICSSLSASEQICIKNSSSCDEADDCGGSMEPDAGDVRPASARVSRCLGPSCPRGECSSAEDCSAYDGFDPSDTMQVCAGATGSNQLCMQTKTVKAGGLVETDAFVVDCTDVTVVRRLCQLSSCGYNYSPDDCAKCTGDNDCSL